MATVAVTIAFPTVQAFPTQKEARTYVRQNGGVVHVVHKLTDATWIERAPDREAFPDDYYIVLPDGFFTDALGADTAVAAVTADTSPFVG